MNLPCILKTTGGHTVCLFENGFGYHLDGCYKGVMTDCKFSIAGSDKNTTAEYLANTYGEVKSEGHANFLVALAKNNGLRVYEASHPIKRDYFTFSKYGKLFFFSKESQMDFKSRKLITIPLPPESNTNTPEEDFEMKQIEKNNGDNLIFGDTDKCKEWPCVGDEVSTRFGNGVIKLLPDLKDCYVIDIGGLYYQLKRDELEKPKTPEEELRDEQIKEMSQQIRNRLVRMSWDEAEVLCADLYELGYRKPQ